MKTSSPDAKKKSQLYTIYNSIRHETSIDRMEFRAFNIISILREQLSIKEGLHMYRNFCEADFASKLIRNRYIRSNYNFFVFYRMPLDEKQNESDVVNWIIETIYFFKTEINEFIKSRDIFYKNLLLGNYHIAESTLSDIERITGCSLWLSNAKLALFFFKNDSDSIANADREYRTLNCELSKSILLYCVAKSNILVSADRYLYAIGKMIEEARLAGYVDGEEGIKFRHDFNPTLEYKSIKKIMSHDCDITLVDMYCNLLRFISYLYIHNIDLNGSASNLKKIQSVIDDRSLHVLTDRISGELSYRDEYDNLHTSISIDYCKGNYHDVILKIKNILLNKPHASEYYELYAKSLLSTGEEKSNLYGPIDEIINLYMNIIRSSKVNLIKRLQKIFHVLSFTSWVYPLQAFLEKHNQNTSSENVYNIYAFNDATSLRDSIFSLKDTDSIAKLKEHGFSDYSKWIQLKFYADINFYNKNFEQAKIQYQELSNYHSEVSKHTNITAKICECYFMNNEENEAISIIANQIKYRKDVACFPVGKIAKYIAETSIYSDDNLSLENRCLTLNYYNRNISPDYVHVVSNIAENIIENQNCYTNRDLITRLNTFNHDFLMHVLTSDVLEGMVNIFSSKRDVLYARLSILYHLVKLYSEKNNELYNTALVEFNGTHQKIVAALCSAEAGNGKISVDKEQLKTYLLEKVDNELNQIRKLDSREYKEVILTADNVNSSEEFEYAYVKDDFHNKLHLLTIHLTEEYTVNRLYGVDQSLNVGIRHGGMLTLLWSPMRKYNLAANKISKGKFVVDDAWRNNFKINFNYFKEAILQPVSERIIDFNKKLSSIYLDYKSRVHVNTGEFINGDKFFFYTTPASLIKHLGENIDSISASMFIDNVFYELDQQTSNIISSLPSTLIAPLRNDISFAFSTFQKDTEKYKLEELSRSIVSAKNEILSRVDILQEWFAWQKASNTELTLAVAVEKAAQVCQELHQPLKLSIELIDKTKTNFEGRFFQSLVQLFHLIIDNACKHSGYSEQIELTCHLTEQKNSLTIKFSNPILKCTDDLKTRIHYKNAIINKDFIEGASQESDSGLFKMKRILSHDLRLKNEILFHISDSAFTIEMTFEKDF
ncbi:hypothetical protein ACK33S_03720 [Aeromonas hydrophila]|uniref:hypothetical protein n=1 Tax=Aeromonas hydrophila TaxID=644 RepID=UPI0039882CB4